MNSPIELIRQGILEGDWQQVCEGFEAMTGMRIDPPSGRVIHGRAAIAEQLRSLLSLVEGSSESQENEPEPEPEPPAPRKKKQSRVQAHPEPAEPTVDPVVARHRERVGRKSSDADVIRTTPTPSHGQGKGQRQARVEPWKPPTSNRFKDNVREFAQEAKWDKMLTKGMTPSQRRDAPKKVTAVCGFCNRQETVDPLFISEEITYKCNDCIRNARRS